jgi:uncharacterized membrane protein
MRLLALLVALLMALIGLTGIVSPETLAALGHHAVTPTGLYVVAAVRIGIGIILLFVASTSRAPRTLRVIGTIAIFAGVATPFVGVEHSRRVMDWWLAQGFVWVRLHAGIALVLGGLLVYAVAPRRQA